MPRDLAYTVLDVFAERPLEGNPLAVFHDGRGLTDAEMQAIARETNLSETTFVLPSDVPDQDRNHGIRVRIFTTQEELPFAGHPTLGTASWLHSREGPLRDAEIVTLLLKAGPVPVRFDRARIDAVGAYGTMRQPDPQFGSEHDRAEVASVVGLTEADLLPGYKPQTVSTGNPFCVVALKSIEILEKLAIPQQRATAWLRQRNARWFYCVAPDPQNSGWRARMQWNTGEDPATGSAAGPCIAWLVRRDLAASGVQVPIRQGVEIHRPSLLMVAATARDNTIVNVHVAGRTIRVAAGHLFLPG